MASILALFIVGRESIEIQIIPTLSLRLDTFDVTSDSTRRLHIYHMYSRYQEEGLFSKMISILNFLTP